MSTETNEIMTFRTGQSLFGVPIQNVLSIMGESDKLFCKAFKSKDALGIMEYRGTPVAVLDLARAGNITSDSDAKLELVEILNDREQDHINWLDTLEKSLVDNEAFTLAKDPHKCKFGLWYDAFETDDEDLKEILVDFDEPHKKIHALADELLGMKDNGELAKALEQLNYEKDTTLAKLRSTFARAVNQLKSTIKPVFIYLTLDGATPCAALRVDEIADVQAANNDDFVAMSDMALPQVNEMDYIKGFLKLGEKGDCLLLDVATLTNQTATVSSDNETEQAKSA